jgi:hypothetical protein
MERARQLDRLLRRRGTPFAFMGGLAVNAWSIPAPTYDIDLCVDLPEEAVPALIRELESEGYSPPPTTWLESVGRARFREISVHWPFQGGLIPADLFVALDEFQREALGRRRTVELDEEFKTDILTPEDLLVYKLIAWRPKDCAAIERLTMVQTSLDWDRVRRWARVYGVEDRLQVARGE